ncbi:MAG TPA: helix-turn-helix domain-containing protein [Coriobacteriia bacterium]
MRCASTTGGTGPFFTTFVEGRRGEILDAALTVFAEKGYECGTMRAIAKLLGLTEPALYRHYAGKEALFADLVAAAGDHLISIVGPALDSLEPATLHEALLALIEMRRKHLPRGDSVKPIMRTLLTSAPHNAAFREVFRTHLGRPLLARLEGFVPRVDAYYGIERTPEELTAKVRAFASLFVGYFITGMMLDLADDDAATVDALYSIMGWGSSTG